MAEKLCLQWHDFQDNVKNAFGHMRDSNDFVDVTLACNDGRHIEAHKVILAASSPFFQRILKGNKHSHPLIYMKGIQSDDLTAIIDFLYYGEANVYQQNLDSFLTIAEELQLKGLEGSTDQKESNEADQMKRYMYKTDSEVPISRTEQIVKETTYISNEKGSNSLLLPKNSLFSELDESVKAMMETSENMIQFGKDKRRAKRCKVCGKEGHASDIKKHIEEHHLEGVSVPCNLCDKILRSRKALSHHLSRKHKNIY